MSFLEILLSSIILLAVVGLTVCYYQHWSGNRDKRLEKKRIKANKESCPFQTDQEIQYFISVKKRTGNGNFYFF